MACLHFSKDVPRMQRDKANSHYNKYVVDELRRAPGRLRVGLQLLRWNPTEHGCCCRGATMGVIGYGGSGL